MRLHTSRRSLLLAATCAMLACAGEKDSGSTSSGGSTSAAGSGGSSVAGAGAGGTAQGGAGAAVGGAGNGNAAGEGGAAGAQTAGAGGVNSGGTSGAAGDGGNAGAGGTNSNCPASALFCDDFEDYPANASDLSPNWTVYTYSGAVQVDDSKPHAGAQSLHLTVEAGMRHYADLIRETQGVELVPLNHYGRMMVWLTAIPDQAHWNLNSSSGPMQSDPEELAKFLQGGMFGKLMSNYAQRGRVKVGDVYPLRGGGPEQGDPGADSDCAVAAPSQTLTAGQWVCWEWQFDGNSNSAYLWLDGTAMTEIDAVGHGTQCQGPGFDGVPMSADYPWAAPQFFDKVWLGYEQYQDAPAQELWIDDVVIASERVGCP